MMGAIEIKRIKSVTCGLSKNTATKGAVRNKIIPIARPRKIEINQAVLIVSSTIADIKEYN